VIAIRSLAGVGWDELAAGFNAAFSDYAVPVAMTAAGLAAMQQRRGYVAAASVGAYDGDRLVGFVMTCLDGDRAYNSGTGVIPSHRRGGLARRLVDAVIEAAPAAEYVLEVIETNHHAAELYRRCGFATRRRLACFTYAAAPAPVPIAAPAIAAPDLAAIAAHADVELSWQNTVASIRRAPEPPVVLGDERGAAVVFPDSADLPLLAVAPAHRRQGHGRRLLAAAAARCRRPLRILNVDDRGAEILALLAAVGATPTVHQLEMARSIP
jgi:ribosomal protein S18 acetylase RimI-like enzyme